MKKPRGIASSSVRIIREASSGNEPRVGKPSTTGDDHTHEGAIDLGRAQTEMTRDTHPTRVLKRSATLQNVME